MAIFSIIKKLQLEGAKRLDAEFYCVSNQIKGDFVLGKDAVEFVQYGTSKELNEERKGFPVLRLNEFDEFFIKTPEKYCDKISKEVFDTLKFKKGDVLICRTNGNPKFVGKSAVVLEDTEIAFASYLFRVRPKKEIISSESLVTFLNSKIGRTQIERFLMPSIQSNFSPTQFRAIKIPILPKDIQNEIDDSVRKSYLLGNESNSLYSQAENLLLEELGLKNFESEIKRELWSVVTLSEAKKVNRIDSDYFQPKYQKMLSLLRVKGGIALGELATLKKGFEPGSEAYQEDGKLFIRVSSISKDGITDKDQKYLKNELCDELKNDYQPKMGEILLTKDASPGMAFVVKEPIDGIISGGVLRVKLKENVEPEYLALVINSIIGQLQVERDAGGSIIMHWKPDQVKELQVPILPKPAQQKIAELVRKSHESRKKAKELLESAKRKVEELIEK